MKSWLGSSKERDLTGIWLEEEGKEHSHLNGQGAKQGRQMLYTFQTLDRLSSFREFRFGQVVRAIYFERSE